MIKFIKNFFYVFLVLAISKNVYAFDLKSLTDKIQKDVGEKLKIPQTNSGSNPLGGMLKGLNQNKGSTMMTTTGQSTSGGSSNKKLAKGLCEPNIPQTIKNLPNANVSLVEKDFGKSRNEIIKILNSIPSSSNDPYVSSLNTFDGAFETKEIEILFNSFLKNKSIDDLAKIRAIVDMKAGFNKNKKQIKADAIFAYGLVHYYLRDNGGKKDLGLKYIKQATAGPDNIGALTVYGAWQFYGINVPQNIQAGNMSALTGYQRADEKKPIQACFNPSRSIPETIKTNPVHLVTKTVEAFAIKYMTTVRNAIATKFIKPKTNITNIRGKQLYTQIPPLFNPALKSLESGLVFIRLNFRSLGQQGNGTNSGFKS